MGLRSNIWNITRYKVSIFERRIIMGRFTISSMQGLDL